MATSCSNTQTPRSDPHDNLDDVFQRWVQNLLDRYHVPGVSVAVVDNGKTESAGYGLARLPDELATADTLYYMASTSKAHGAATMGLVLKDNKGSTIPPPDPSNSRKKLDWSTPIKEILGDDFDLGDEYITQHVTVEDALSNRSSLSGHDLNFGPWLGSESEHFIPSLRYLAPLYMPFRTKFQYCNAMFAVAGHTIEKLEGKDFDAVARERLWEPLGMQSTFSGLRLTTPASKDIQKGKRTLARGYYWVEESEGQIKQEEHPTNNGYYVCDGYNDITLLGPAGAVVSSVNDYSKWITALLNAANPSKQKDDAENPTESITTHELWNELTTPRTIVLPSINFFVDVDPSLDYANISPELCALGWFVGTNWMYHGQTLLHHSGGLPGFGTHVFLLPKHNFGVVIAANTMAGGGKLSEQIGRELIGKKIGISKDERRCEGDFAPRQDGPKADTDAIRDGYRGDLAKPTAISITAAPESAPESAPEPPQASLTALTEHFNAQAASGLYWHGAYGQVQVSIASPSASTESRSPTLDDVRILRKTPESKSEPSDKVSDLAIHVAFQGSRTFKTTILLHPPPPAVSSVQTAKHTCLTLEKLWAHGSLTSDVIPDLPKGHGKADEAKYPFKQEALWESIQILPSGACFERTEDGEKRLGMILANTESMEAATRSGEEKDMPLEDWQMKMVWFDRVKQAGRSHKLSLAQFYRRP